MKNFSRRDFISVSAAGVACASMNVVQGCSTLGVAKVKPKVGVQLYSIRDLCGKDLVGTLKTVKGIGYAGVEFAGTYGKSAKELKQILDDNGLVACGTHSGLDSIKPEKLSATLEFYNQLGCPYVTVPSMNAKDAAGWVELAKLFDVAQQRAKTCLLYTSPSPRDGLLSRMPSSA